MMCTKKNFITNEGGIMSEEQTRVFRAYDPEKQFEMLEEASDELAKAVYKEFLV